MWLPMPASHPESTPYPAMLPTHLVPASIMPLPFPIPSTPSPQPKWHWKYLLRVFWVWEWWLSQSKLWHPINNYFSFNIVFIIILICSVWLAGFISFLSFFMLTLGPCIWNMVPCSPLYKWKYRKRKKKSTELEYTVMRQWSPNGDKPAWK